MTIMVLNILAQAEGNRGFGGSALIIQLGLIALVFYFLIIRPQSQARKKHEALLDDLKKGDEVVTSGGPNRAPAMQSSVSPFTMPVSVQM